MVKIHKLSFVAAILILSACSSDDSVPQPNFQAGGPAPDIFRIQVLRASPDAPGVDILVSGATAISALDYKQSSPAITLETGSYDIQVVGVTRDGPTTVTIDAGGIYTAIARDAEGCSGGLPLGLILLDDFS